MTQQNPPPDRLVEALLAIIENAKAALEFLGYRVNMVIDPDGDDGEGPVQT